jgi:hypothetical protein
MHELPTLSYRTHARVMVTDVGVDIATASDISCFLSEQLLLLIGQRSVVEQRLNLELLDVLDAYLLQNELGVLNGERILEDGHTPSGLDQHHQRYLRDCRMLLIHMPYRHLQVTMNGIIVSEVHPIMHPLNLHYRCEDLNPLLCQGS